MRVPEVAIAVAALTVGSGAPLMAQSSPLGVPLEAAQAAARSGAAEDTAGCSLVLIAGAGATKAEESRAADACREARSSFDELFGDPVPAVRLILWDRGGYRTGVAGDTAVVFWPEDRTRDGKPADPAMLPHEIGHVLLAARFYGNGANVSGGYGTPLPDWFEEAVAIWGEPASQKAERVAQAKALPPARRSLPSILTSPHPAARNKEILATRDGAPIPADQALWDFYPQSIAALTFVYDHGGRPAVKALERRLQADPSDADGLAGLPGLPSKESDVVREWNAWMTAGPAVGSASAPGRHAHRDGVSGT